MPRHRDKPKTSGKTTANSDKQQFAKDEAKPVPIVDCPPELGPVARQEWDRLARELTAAGRLTIFDRAPLAIYCSAYAQWLEAVDALQRYGTVMKSPSGYPVQSTYVSIANRQVDIMIRISCEFGFTPASRSRVPRPSKSDLMLLELSSLEDFDVQELQIE
jgi:P27 family predicted phage terminase small subunit